MPLGIFFPSLPFCRSQTLFVPEQTLGLLRRMRPVLGSYVWDKLPFFLKHLPHGQETLLLPQQLKYFEMNVWENWPLLSLIFPESQWRHEKKNPKATMKPPFDFIYIYLVMTFVVAKIHTALSNHWKDGSSYLALWTSSKSLSFYLLLFVGNGVMVVFF